MFYKALPKENEMNQGLVMLVNWFMALRFKEASSSDCPPERKTIPGMAGTTVLEKAKTVL